MRHRTPVTHRLRHRTPDHRNPVRLLPAALTPLVPEQDRPAARAGKPPAPVKPPAVPPPPPEKPLPAVKPPDVPPPPPEKKAVPRKLVAFSADDLHKQLLQVPEVDFFEVAERLKKDIRTTVADKVRRAGLAEAFGDPRRRLLEEAGRVQFTNTVNVAVLEDARRQGLPVQTGKPCRAELPAAVAMQKLSRELRLRQIVASPGLPRNRDVLDRLRQWFIEHPPADNPGTRRVLLQMLEVEGEGERQLLLGELSRGKDGEAVAALGNLAVFDASAAIRRKATGELKKHSPDACRDVLLRSLRYVWSPAADNAARALVELKDRKAVPALLDLLGRPDPALPLLDGNKKQVVRELVRLRHLRNCYLCHPAVPVLEAPVGGFVPPDGLSVPPLYYSDIRRPPGDYVRTDVTFVRQDFSVLQATPDAGPGLTRQRFDFLVRTRPATPLEIARLKEPPTSYPQREAVLFAPCELTGKDFGLSTRAWLDGLSERPKAAPPDLLADAGRPTLLADLTALDVGPEARPHRRALSPDGKLTATAVGNQVVVAAAGDRQPLFVLEGHRAPITSVWWSLQGDTIAADDTEGMVTVHDARGRQILAFSK